MDNNAVSNNTGNERNIRIYSVLAYIGLLWIVGLLVKEKNNKSLRFHVGQGMLITITNIAISIFNSVVVYNIFTTTEYVLGTSVRVVSSMGRLVGGLLGLVPLALMIFGIVKAANGKEEELPVIGKYAFYK